MRLHTAGVAIGFRKPTLARVTLGEVPPSERSKAALVLSSISGHSDLKGYAAVVSQEPVELSSPQVPIVHSVRHIDHFQPGHIIAIEPANGFIRTIYRSESRHNILFATERCNSNCLMCSQPPKDSDDTDALTKRNLDLLDLISSAPEYLCITGGEPTLLGDRLFKILEKLSRKFPETHVHMLTNGRRFAWHEFTAAFVSTCPPDFSVGIPLYSDSASLHDYVVQAHGAFDQTVLGLHQLARHGISVEIRVVLHALTIPRLKYLSEYICRNLTFVDHVALMGLEQIGYTPRNIEELWIDPVEYQDELEESVAILTRFGIETRIYNHQLCVLKRSLWKYAKQAISDWKNSYVECCGECGVRDQCGGFFHWVAKKQSKGIHALEAAACE
jgi:His-Xaa-Ser system radical SAM maturase HxsC